MPVVLVALSDADLRSRFTETLSVAEFLPIEAKDAREAIRAAFEMQPAAIVLDGELDQQGDTRLLTVLRAASDVPMLFLSSAADPGVTVDALNDGADDVMHPGVDPREFLARLKAAIRRASRAVPAVPENQSVVTGNLEIQRDQQRVLKNGKVVALTRTEYRLLDALASRAGQVAPHRFLLSTVWGEDFVDDTQYLRVYVGYVRAKIEDDPSNPRYLLNDWGLGYRLAMLAPVTAAPSDGDATGSGDGRSSRD